MRVTIPTLFNNEGGTVRYHLRARRNYNVHMTSPFLALLKQIASGVIIYEPFQRTSRELMDFQDTVHRLQEMERLGLVRHVFTQVRSIAGQEFYDLAMVQGGLTEEGRRLLAEQQDKSPES